MFVYGARSGLIGHTGGPGWCVDGLLGVWLSDRTRRHVLKVRLDSQVCGGRCPRDDAEHQAVLIVGCDDGWRQPTVVMHEGPGNADRGNNHQPCRDADAESGQCVLREGLEGDGMTAYETETDR